MIWANVVLWSEQLLQKHLIYAMKWLQWDYSFGYFRFTVHFPATGGPGTFFNLDKITGAYLKSPPEFPPNMWRLGRGGNWSQPHRDFHGDQQVEFAPIYLFPPYVSDFVRWYLGPCIAKQARLSFLNMRVISKLFLIKNIFFNLQNMPIASVNPICCSSTNIQKLVLSKFQNQLKVPMMANINLLIRYGVIK